jgi:predicted transcriptional regulator
LVHLSNVHQQPINHSLIPKRIKGVYGVTEKGLKLLLTSKLEAINHSLSPKRIKGVYKVTRKGMKLLLSSKLDAYNCKVTFIGLA